MLRDELKQLLRELADATDALRVCIAPASPAPADGTGPASSQDSDPAPLHVEAPLGGSYTLFATFGEPEPRDATEPRRAAVERTARAIRASARRWEQELPTLEYPEESTAQDRNVRARIDAFLGAFTNTLGMVNAAVTVGAEVICSASPLTDLQRERVPFIIKQVGAEATRSRESSHAEVAGDDFFARSFWFQACIVAYFDRTYSLDFVRHRARLVARELSQLLPMLDDPEHDPVITSPKP